MFFFFLLGVYTTLRFNLLNLYSRYIFPGGKKPGNNSGKKSFEKDFFTNYYFNKLNRQKYIKAFISFNDWLNFSVISAGFGLHLSTLNDFSLISIIYLIFSFIVLVLLALPAVGPRICEYTWWQSKWNSIFHIIIFIIWIFISLYAIKSGIHAFIESTYDYTYIIIILIVGKSSLGVYKILSIEPYKLYLEDKKVYLYYLCLSFMACLYTLVLICVIKWVIILVVIILIIKLINTLKGTEIIK